MKQEQTNKEINALKNFLNAYNGLTENFNNDTMQHFYPFAESFDEIKVKEWVNSAIELTLFTYNQELKKRFLLSKVKLTKEVIKQMYGYEINTDTAFIYLNGYFIEIDVKGFYVMYENFGDYFNTIEEAENHFFNNFVKHEFTND